MSITALALGGCTGFESNVQAPNHRVEVVANDVLFADGLAFHPTGALLATEEYRGGGVLRIDPLSGASTHIVRDLDDPDNLLVIGTDIYVTEEAVLGRILKIDAGERVTTFASGLDNPEGLDLGPDGHVYVAEHSPSGKIFRYPLAGGPRQAFGGAVDGEGLRVLDDGSVIVAETSVNRVARFDASGAKSIFVDELEAPDGIAYDRERARVLVTEDAAPGRLLAVDLASGELRVLATGLHKPQTMLIEGDGSILVSEQGEHRILRLRPLEGTP